MTSGGVTADCLVGPNGIYYLSCACVSVRVCACTQLTELMFLFNLCDFL